MILSLKKNRSIDENLLATRITNVEGRKVEVNIAQVKEVQRVLLELLCVEWRTNPHGVAALLEKHAK